MLVIIIWCLEILQNVLNIMSIIDFCSTIGFGKLTFYSNIQDV